MYKPKGAVPRVWVCLMVYYSIKRWRCWLRHCAVSLNAAGSIPDDDTGIFHWHNPSGPLEPNKAFTRNISWERKGGRCVGPTTLPHSYTDFLQILEPRLTGTLRACPGLYRDFFTVYYLSPKRARQLYHVENLHSPRHAVAAAMPNSAIKGILSVYLEWYNARKTELWIEVSEEEGGRGLIWNT